MSSTQTSSSTLLRVGLISLALCYLSTIAVEAAPLGLMPPTVDVNVNSKANFTCTLSCDHQGTILWIVGDHEKFQYRLILLARFDAEDFKSKTGISVSVEEDNTCGMPSGDRRVRQILRINADSVDLNKTPVQCATIPTMPGANRLYSPYSVLKVSDPTPPVELSGSTSNDCRQTVKAEQGTDATESQSTGTPLPAGMTTDSGASSLSPLLLLHLTLIGLLAHYLCYL